MTVMMKQCLFATLCALLCVAVTSQSTLKLGVLNASNNWWLAVTDIDAAATTNTIEIKQGSDDWITMRTDNNPQWRYWIFQSTNGQPFTFPLSFRLTSTDGKQLTALSAIVSFTGRDEVVDTLTQYGLSSTPVDLATPSPATEPIANEPIANEPIVNEPIANKPIANKPSDNEVVIIDKDAEEIDINADDWCKKPSKPNDGNYNNNAEEQEPQLPATDAPLPPTKAPSAGNGGYVQPTVPAQNPTKSPTTPPAQATTTRKPATSAPTSNPTSTKAATKAPTKAATTAPIKAATTAPSSGSGSSAGCNAPMKLMVPLYTYPGSTWDTVISNAKVVKTLVIINPSNGPGTKVDSKFSSYIKKMVDAGVEVVGYVYTQYGARSADIVKRDIDFYASEYPGVTGIFLDEAANSNTQLPYYQDLHKYIMSMPGYTQNIINPGAVPTAGYMDASTNIVSFESAGSKSISSPSFANCNNKEHFSAIAYGVASGDIISYLDTLFSKGYFGYVYATSTGLTGGTYNSLPSYYAQMASYVATKNSAKAK